MYTAKRHLTMLYSNISNLCHSHQIFWPWYPALDGLRWPFQRPDIDIGDHEKLYQPIEKHWNENRPGLNHIVSRDPIFCWILRSKLSFACIFDMQKVLYCDLENKKILSQLCFRNAFWSRILSRNYPFLGCASVSTASRSLLFLCEKWSKK